MCRSTSPKILFSTLIEEEINGKITFAVASSFAGATTIDGKVVTTNDGIDVELDFDKEHILLDAGDQTLTPVFDIKSDTTISNLEAKIVNGVDLSTVDNYLTWDDDQLLLNTIGDLTVDNLEIKTLPLKDIYKVNDNAVFDSISKIDVEDLTTKSMKKRPSTSDEVQNALLNYKFSEDFTAVDLDTKTINEETFDANNFVHLHEFPPTGKIDIILHQLSLLLTSHDLISTFLII